MEKEARAISSIFQMGKLRLYTQQWSSFDDFEVGTTWSVFWAPGIGVCEKSVRLGVRLVLFGLHTKGVFTTP